MVFPMDAEAHHGGFYLRAGGAETWGQGWKRSDQIKALWKRDIYIQVYMGKK